jgi:hypothetical protein
MIITPEAKKQLKAAFLSYVRAAAAAVGAVLLAGIDNPGTITISALIGGLIGPLIKALDKNDDSYGIGAKVEAAVSAVPEEKVAE